MPSTTQTFETYQLEGCNVLASPDMVGILLVFQQGSIAFPVDRERIAGLRLALARAEILLSQSGTA